MKHLFLLLSIITLLTQCTQSKKRPNILLIMADDIGIEGLQCYGGEDYKTPHLDKLAKGGVRFTHAYSQPLCTPTRLQIMTGKYNNRNWQYFGILPKGEKTFGHLMSDLGYKTLLAGKWQLTSYDPPDFPSADKRRGTGTHPKDAGFDEYILFHAEETEDKGSRYADPTYIQNGELHQELKGKYGEDITVDYILDFMKKNKDEEMFVYYPMALPHDPFVPTPDSEEWQDESKRHQKDTKYFADMVEYMDKLVGRLVQGLDDLGLRENTIVMFYSDNGTHKKIQTRFKGESIQGGKASPLQTAIRVPLIVSCPEKIDPQVNGDIIDASDFLPTLVEVGESKVPKTWKTDGVSFAPTLFGKEGTKRDWAFFWYDPRPGWDKFRFSRHIFALDKKRKYFSDGRLYDIEGLGFKEKLIEEKDYKQSDKESVKKLSGVISQIMAGPNSWAAENEVDGYGNPIDSKK